MLQPLYPLPSQPRLGRGLQALAELHQWECAHVPFIATPSGRALYFCVAEQFLLKQTINQMLLKALPVGVSVRAMRQRLREFEQLGLIRTYSSAKDARIRNIEPTPHLLALFEAHTMAMRKIFSQKFVYTPLTQAP